MSYLLLWLMICTVSADYRYSTRYDRPIVRTEYGRVMGATLTSRDGKDYYAFNKIPYAKPPCGNLRFQVRGFLLHI